MPVVLGASVVAQQNLFMLKGSQHFLKGSYSYFRKVQRKDLIRLAARLRGIQFESDSSTLPTSKGKRFQLVLKLDWLPKSKDPPKKTLN